MPDITDRDRILAAARGELLDRIAWLPRLDFWYRARKRKGTLPEGLEGKSLDEITDSLGLARYAVVPDLTEPAGPGVDPFADRGLNIFHIRGLAYDVAFKDVEREVHTEGEATVTTYRTPHGPVRTATMFTEGMQDAGASIPWVSEVAVKQPSDLPAVAWIFSRARVTPRPDRFAAYHGEIGSRGVAVAWAYNCASPMQLLMRELMHTEQFFYAMTDGPEALESAAEGMEPFFAGVREASADSAAEIVLYGANYDDSITHPRFFRRHILPQLQRYGEQLHARGKFLLTHTDGENRGLLPLYLEAGFDIADSVCPAPMTRCTLDELLSALGERITILGGVPSVLLESGTASWDEFKAFVDGALEKYGRHPRFILGVSDMVTAEAEWDRLLYITDRVHGLA